MYFLWLPYFLYRVIFQYNKGCQNTKHLKPFKYNMKCYRSHISFLEIPVILSAAPGISMEYFINENKFYYALRQFNPAYLISPLHWTSTYLSNLQQHFTSHWNIRMIKHRCFQQLTIDQRKQNKWSPSNKSIISELKMILMNPPILDYPVTKLVQLK